MTTTAQTIHATYLSRIQSAHTALFKLVESQDLAPEYITYADAGVSLQISPGVSPSTTVKAFFNAKGRVIPGLEIVAPDERTASYLFLDTAKDVRKGALDYIIQSRATASAYIENISGYPTILGWDE